MDDKEPKISHAIEDGVLCITIEGWVSIEDIAAYAEINVDLWAKSPRLLYDLRQMRFYDITNEGLNSVFDVFFGVGSVRIGWRTAILLRGQEFSLGDVLVRKLEAREVPINIKAFDSKDEARVWLLGD